MLRSFLMFVVSLGALTILVAPNANWMPAPVSAPVAAESLESTEVAAVTNDAGPSFIVPVKRVAFPTAPAAVTETVELVDAAATPTSDDVRIVTAEALNLRDRPSSSSTVLGKLVAGESVTVIGQERTWLEVITADGTSGWISSRFVKTPS